METMVEPRPEAELPAAERSQPWYRRRSTIAVALLLVYAVVSLGVDPRGHLSTDVGGKTASIDAMVERGDWDPDIGHWFEGFDPEGRFHPFAHTSLSENGTWINTTSLTMIYVARPLWELGGPRAILLLPMLGSLGAALAAGALHRRLRPGDDGTLSIWVVGLASPALIYAMDVWEHSWGLALMTVGVVKVLDAVRDRAPAKAAAVGGLVYGLAATMRQEALVYGFVAGVVLVGTLLAQRRLVTALGRGALMAVAAIIPLALHAALEVSVLGGSARAARGASTLGSAGTDAADRVLSILGTTVFAMPSTSPISWVLSAGLLTTGIHLAVSLARSDGPASPILLKAMVAAWTVWVIVFAYLGLGFVPGLAVAGPPVLFGLAGMIRERWWLAGAVGVGPLPVVAVTAFAAGAFPQWGGRYILTSGLVLTVMGLVWLAARSRTTLRVVVGLAVVVSALGAAWTIERTNQIGDAGDRITQITAADDIVVWRSPFKAREFGELANGRSWLSAPYDDDRVELARLLEQSGANEFHWVGREQIEANFPGWVATEVVDELQFLNVRIVRFVRQPAS